MAVLQLVVLDVEPQGLHDAGTCLRVHAQQTSQPWVQLVLRRLEGVGSKTALVNESWPGQPQVLTEDTGAVPGGRA